MWEGVSGRFATPAGLDQRPAQCGSSPGGACSCAPPSRPGRPPLLLIHGYPTASYDWVRVWPRLAARHSLYALDLLGFGRSEKPRDTDYPIELQADLCMALLDDRGVGNAHVLAHDYGDTVAQELLAREREGQLRIASMAFLNGGLFPETHRARPIQKLLANPLLGPLLARAMDYGEVRADHAVDRRAASRRRARNCRTCGC